MKSPYLAIAAFTAIVGLGADQEFLFNDQVHTHKEQHEPQAPATRYTRIQFTHTDHGITAIDRRRPETPGY